MLTSVCVFLDPSYAVCSRYSQWSLNDICTSFKLMCVESEMLQMALRSQTLHVLHVSSDSCHHVVQNIDIAHSRYLHVELNVCQSIFIALFTNVDVIFNRII